MTVQPDLWPQLRSALAETTRQHWTTLRRISGSTDPRLTAAESVATAALALIQEPATWVAAEIVLAVERTSPEQASMLAEAVQLAPADFTAALRRLETLDVAARTWSETAYQRSRRRT